MPDGIGVKNESSLHSAIKEWYSLPDDEFEIEVDDFVVDIVRDDLLIEVQTGNFSGIKHKLRKLVQRHPLRLIYPMPVEKWLVYVSLSGNEVVCRRKSPYKGELIHIFRELVSIPTLINEGNFEIEVLMTREEEIRCRDGKGSWRRRGISIKDRQLLGISDRIVLRKKWDFLPLLPDDLSEPFSNMSLSASTGASIRDCRRMTYCLRKMGVIEQVGKDGNWLLYEVRDPS